MDLRNSVKLAGSIISSVFLFGFTYSGQCQDSVIIHSVDGIYTYDKEYALVQVVHSHAEIANFSFKYNTTLENRSNEGLDKIELIIDLYGEHDLLNSSFIPIYQCKQSLGLTLSEKQTIEFTGSCNNLPQKVVSKFAKFRISIGKLNDL